EGDTAWVFMGLRIMLAISVIEFMPDQELFAIIHPGPPKLKLSRKYGVFREIKEKFRDICRGYLCKHLNQSSPVFAILATIADGWVGWFCYGVAIVQYLIIGLVTSKDKALDVLSEFDRQVALRRRELIEEFELTPQAETSKTTGTDSPAEDPAHTMPPPSTNIKSAPATPDDVAIQQQDGYES
ncbi:MAG: DNA topoisomerase I, partial [Planctomycetes bacterium]|nr:DNA topoisomerase I [Planctomycetota bacterium]